MTRESREIPMLYSSDMVRAIINGLKSQTRRLTKLDKINAVPDAWEFFGLNREGDLKRELKINFLALLAWQNLITLLLLIF